MRTLLVALVTAFLLTSVAGCKTECERAAEKVCAAAPDEWKGSKGRGSRSYCEGHYVLECAKAR
jgi:hypothetical protein